MLLEKSQTFQNDIIFVDGLWGTGKSLIGPIVSGMDRVEKVKIEHIYEHLCIMHHLGKINSDALMWLLKTYADLSQYNNVIGREVNLRWRDESGLANNPNSLKYIKRLFGGDGDQKVADINEQNLALNIMSHMILLVAAPLFEAYGKRLKIVEVLRHPLYMVRHWYAFLQRFDAPRIFTIATQHKEQKVPWFAHGWEEEFIQASHMDKVLLSIMRTFERLDQALGDAHTKGHQVLALSFEALAIQPGESLQQLEVFLGRHHHPRLPAILRKQKMPRKTISQGRGYAKYGWTKDLQSSEQEVYAKHLAFMKAEGSPVLVQQFLQLIESYNKKFPNILSQYQ